MALTTTFHPAVWYLDAFTQVASTIHITIIADNTSSINVADNPINYPRSEHIDVGYHFTRDHLICNFSALSHAPANDNSAYLMAKKLNSVYHHLHMQRLGLSEWECVLRHTFYTLSWDNTIILIPFILSLLWYSMTVLLISHRHLSIILHLFLIWLYSLLRCIILTLTYQFWSWLYVSLTLFLFSTLSYGILHLFLPDQHRIPTC